MYTIRRNGVPARSFLNSNIAKNRNIDIIHKTDKLQSLEEF